MDTWLGQRGAEESEPTGFTGLAPLCGRCQSSRKVSETEMERLSVPRLSSS